MRVTPLDIRKQEFKKVMRGLDSDEVYAFLNTVADEYEAVLSDNKNLREKLVALEERINEYKTIETNLRNTLLTAEKLTQEAKENARREASLIVRQAEMEADKAAESIRAHTAQLRREIFELKKNKDNYIARLKTLLESHRKMLDGFEEDFAGVDRAIEEIGQQVEEDARRPAGPPRMSREKITQDFGREPKDKVTWGDDRRREEEQRPQVPRPGYEDREAPNQRVKPPENQNIFAAPHAGPDRERAERRETQPHRPSEQLRMEQVAGPGIATAPQPHPADVPPMGHPEGRPAQDDWRGYEVRKQPVDWKSYVIPDHRPPAAGPQPAPQEAELDDALSSLKEAADPGGETPHRRGETPQASGPAPAPPRQQKPEADRTGSSDESTWSMEELRRNLTNLAKDEEHKR